MSTSGSLPTMEEDREWTEEEDERYARISEGGGVVISCGDHVRLWIFLFLAWLVQVGFGRTQDLWTWNALGIVLLVVANHAHRYMKGSRRPAAWTQCAAVQHAVLDMITDSFLLWVILGWIPTSAVCLVLSFLTTVGTVPVGGKKYDDSLPSSSPPALHASRASPV